MLKQNHDQYYRTAWAMAERYLDRVGDPNWWVRWRLSIALKHASRAVSMVPDNWPTYWLIGKIHQKMGRHQAALEAFRTAFAIEPSHPDVAREAAIEAIEVGKGDEAVRFARKGVKSNPHDPGLVSNLALALLIKGDVELSRDTAQEAVKRAPHDRISVGVKQLIDDVAAGRAPRPLKGADLRR